MKKHKPQRIPLGSFAAAACLLALVPHCHGKSFPFPPLNEAVDKAAAPANLRAVAAQTTDPEVWLGLSFLAQPGDPVRPELSEMAVKAKPEFRPVAIVLANAMDGVEEQSIAELIRRDPSNALGYYLLGVQVSKPGKEKESLEAFRKGAACAELRLYGGAVSNMLFKALDALKLKGRDRLCASSWMATRWANFEIINLQPQGNVLQQLAKDADLGTRKEISDLLLAVAGHLISSDFQNQVFGERVLLGAFHLKADIAASEKSPTMNGYVGVVQALVSTRIDRPRSQKEGPRELAQFLPGRIWRAYVVLDPQLARTNLVELKGKPPGADAVFDKAYANWVKASKALIDSALPDQDEIIGAYFCGHLPPRANAPFPWAESGTYVERLVKRKPELFKAAAVNEDAMRAMYETRNPALTGTKQTGSPAMDAPIAAKDACITNLRLIDGAKQAWAIEMGKQVADTPSWSDLQPYIGRGPNGALPKCPSSGTYTIGTIGVKPECSVAGHVCP